MRIYNILLVLLTLSWAFCADAAEKKSEAESRSETNAELKPQETCPIMGSKINKALYVDVNGQRIYACCSACLLPCRFRSSGQAREKVKGHQPAVNLPLPTSFRAGVKGGGLHQVSRPELSEE